jgi:hypothetical protein
MKVEHHKMGTTIVSVKLDYGRTGRSISRRLLGNASFEPTANFAMHAAGFVSLVMIDAGIAPIRNIHLSEGRMVCCPQAYSNCSEHSFLI